MVALCISYGLAPAFKLILHHWYQAHDSGRTIVTKPILGTRRAEMKIESLVAQGVEAPTL